MSPLSHACEDCGEETPIAGPGRLRVCTHCEKNVCPWCDHHIHAMGREAARREAHALFALPPLEGVPPDMFWVIAFRAHTSIGTVMAIAGGHTHFPGKSTWLPVRKVRQAARAIAEQLVFGSAA